MAIAPTSKSAAAPAALIDGDQMSIVELPEGDLKLLALVREAGDSEVDGGMLAAGGGRKGKRAEYRRATCGYGIIIYGRPPDCPMCREARWEHVEWRPLLCSTSGVDPGPGAESDAFDGRLRVKAQLTR